MLQLMKDEMNVLKAYSSTIDKETLEKCMARIAVLEGEIDDIYSTKGKYANDGDDKKYALAKEKDDEIEDIKDTMISFLFSVRGWLMTLNKIDVLEKKISILEIFEEEERKKGYKKSDQQSRLDLLLKM